MVFGSIGLLVEGFRALLALVELNSFLCFFLYYHVVYSAEIASGSFSGLAARCAFV